MRSIVPQGGNDKVMTPLLLAQDIVNYFNPFGQKCLEPCKGTGNFVTAFENISINPEWCEIDEGIDFFEFDKKVDWIITNPPYSILSNFLEHCVNVSDNVVFLCLGNALFFKKRIRIIKHANFGFKEMIFVDTPPKPWPQFGIQLAVIHLAKNYKGDVKFKYGLK